MPCRAARWNAIPCYEGPHGPHNFVYGPNGLYHGHCNGEKPPPAPLIPRPWPTDEELAPWWNQAWEEHEAVRTAQLQQHLESLGRLPYSPQEKDALAQAMWKAWEIRRNAYAKPTLAPSWAWLSLFVQ